MLSSLYLMPRQELEEQNFALKKRARILHDFFELGPWKINFQLLSRFPNPFDFSSEQNIFAPYLDDNPSGEFIYIRGGYHVFMIWKKDQPTSAGRLDEFKKIWDASFPQSLNDPVLQTYIDEIRNVPLVIAPFPWIEKDRNSLPDKVGEHKYGCCSREDGSLMDLGCDLKDGGCISSSTRFIVYTLSEPYGKLPGIADYYKYKSAPNAALYKLDAEQRILHSDHIRCRLTPLAPATLTDKDLGHWDLYWPESANAKSNGYALHQLEKPLIARDPAKDIRKDAVAIDFGTASTVIANRDRHGRVRLVRIGAQPKDMAEKPTPEQFENPTVLNFENAEKFFRAWQNQPWRPAIDWNDIQCAHQAREDLEKRIQSGFTMLKSWGRSEPGSEPVLLEDKNRVELRFSMPAQIGGDIEKDTQGAPLNPIEIYAFFLGLFLNNQNVEGGRIFTNYYMTFPVKYERAARNRILASFRRGLMRSLPATLIYGSGWNPENLRVTEKANEPAAFAAAVLPLLNEQKGRLITQNSNNFAKNSNETIDQDFLIYKIYRKYCVNNTGTLEKLREYIYKSYNLNSEELMKILNKFNKNHKINKDIIYELYEQLPKKSASEYEQFKKKVCFAFSIPEEQFIYCMNEPEKKTNHISSVTADLLPTAEGVAFGVFDFGGGTTDFAIGLYRLPTEEEEDENGWEQVVDILDASGDPDLGGERLVWDLAFAVVCANLDKMRSANVFPFQMPPDEQMPTGGEEVFNSGSVARTNTLKICKKLRPLWEQGRLEDQERDQIGVTLQDKKGEESILTLNVDTDALNQLLKKRIAAGVDAFFSTVRQAFRQVEKFPPLFHVILAGNSCRSPLVEECFLEQAPEFLKQESPESSIILHEPLRARDGEAEGVTMKTGVAYGLLQTLDGEATGMVMRHPDNDEAPFNYNLGPLKGGILQPVLIRNAPYGEWHSFGKVRSHGICKYHYTTSSLALEQKLGREDCLEDSLDFGAANAGREILVKAVSPKKARFGLKNAEGKIEESDDWEILLA